MKVKFITHQNVLTIKGMSFREKLFYVFKICLLILGMAIFLWLNQLKANLIFLCLAIPQLIAFRRFLFIPEGFSDIVIIKKEDKLLVNKQSFEYDELLFLSMKEFEQYHIIRLEAERDSILFANEKILIHQRMDYDTCLGYCRFIRDFISPDLKINDMTMGHDEPNYESLRGNTGGGGRNSETEVWHFID